MANLLQKCKKWISLSQTLDFESIITDLKATNFKQQPDESNKYLFKLLMHLAHSADKCHREKLSKEVEIFTISNIICINITSVSDQARFYSSLYYIIFYLLSKQYLVEAKVICSYLVPGNKLDIDFSDNCSKYYQIATLWQNEIVKKFDKASSKSKQDEEVLNGKIYSFLKFNFEILKTCDNSLSYTMKIADYYVKKLANVSLDIAFPCILKIVEYMSTYVKTLKAAEIVEAYTSFIPILSFAFYKRTDTKGHSKILHYFRQCDSFMLEMWAISSESYNNYKLFREFSLNVLETNFMSNELGLTRFQKVTGIFETLTQRYGEKSNAFVETVCALTSSFETLFGVWENLVLKRLANTKVTVNDIILMGNFYKKVFAVHKNRALPAESLCKKCSDPPKCLIKNDAYNAVFMAVFYLRVITKFTADTLDEKLFLLATELLEQMVSIYNEMDELKCKNSPSLWDMCGRMIFNVGLISELKYPEKLEGLYFALCTQIVRNDGLNSKLSSFGLDNPVATSLHRLCIINSNQGKYRKALGYIAYSALLSNSESRQKKAYDTWANIKTKGIEIEEIKHLTILECLKTDVKQVKTLGIDVNIKDYDLADLCVRELKSLFPLKDNMMVSMKKIVDTLEKLNDTEKYAQGVLLLCFHVQSFSSRELISDYIKKATAKLESQKQKRSISCECLLANLKFFSIVEKLYVRSQAIDKEIDDASFTMKAFKVLQGNQLDKEEETDKEVVPTYGGINIHEDNKCANELREVLSMWENLCQKNLMSITTGWEPKYTLETVIICGEYSRLFHFNKNEEKAWKIAHTLASALKDPITCIYITGRSVSLRCINDAWINESEKYLKANIKTLDKAVDLDIVSLYKLSLADFYCDCRKFEEAKVLIEEVESMSNYNMLSNPKVFIYRTDIRFRNYYQLNAKTSQEAYCQLLVEVHYSLINLHDVTTRDAYRFWTIRFNLFATEQILECMCNLIIPMNSLLSYREITAHMIYGIKTAQKLGLTVRIAQFLRYFCHLDLLRLQIEDCETRLQDLEHILCIEQFQASQHTKLQEDVARTEPVSKVRNAGVPISFSRNNASPELKKKVFTMPDFLEHSTYCMCFECTNLLYQHMSFCCTYLRAHLYSLLNYTKEAEQLFYGASKIRMRLDQRDPDSARQHKLHKWKRHQSFTVDYLLYLLDFAMHVHDFAPSNKDEALALIEETLEIAAKNDLSKHCVAMSANELYFQHHVYELFDKSSIDVSMDVAIDITNNPVDGCSTPKQQTEKTTRNPRRRKSPAAIAIPIPVISVGDSSDEENNCGNSPRPKERPKRSATMKTEIATKQPTKKVSVRTVRRKILIDDAEDSAKGEDSKEEEAKQSRKSSRIAKKSIGSNNT